MKKRMSIREFQKRGYLFEVNRRFFHPLGLALAVSAPSPTSESRRLDCIIDARDGDDREGIIMGDWTQEQIDNANRIDQELTDGFDPARKAGLGWVTEPVPSALPEWARVALGGSEMSQHKRGEHKGPPELCLDCRIDRARASKGGIEDLRKALGLIETEGAEADPDVAETAWAIIEHHARHRTAG